jgi:UDP-glucuronate decarboxylase
MTNFTFHNYIAFNHVHAVVGLVDEGTFSMRAFRRRRRSDEILHKLKQTMANSRISLTGGGRRAAANSLSGLNRRHGAAPRPAQGYSLFTKNSFLILAVGILMGYILLPLLMIEVQMDSIMDKLPINANSDMMINYSGRKNAKEETTTPAATYKNAYLRPVDSAMMSKPARTLDVLDRDQTAKLISDVEQRIVEDHDFLSRQSVPTYTTPYIMKTAKLPDHQRRKILITGGAGFVGSHLVDKLMMEGQEVTVVDNFFTGQKKNIAHWLHHPNFRYVFSIECLLFWMYVFSIPQHLRISFSHFTCAPNHYSLLVHDVTEELTLEVDQVYHLACPASPPHYQYNPVKTIKTSTMGTLNMLGLAKRVHARILLTSTSEIYGDPQIHPQPESYWGNVNTIGPRSCYDEGKRVAETMMYSYKNQNNVDVRVARIFNTFGPRMHPNDGRVVSNFIIQALQSKNLTIYGSGLQTRSFQYVSDLVEGLYKLMNGGYDQPVNLGNPEEYSVKEFAEYIKNITESDSNILFLPKQQDDPSQRRPDIRTAQEQLGWKPQVPVEQGLRKTIQYFQKVLDEAGEIVPTGPGASKPEA